MLWPVSQVTVYSGKGILSGLLIILFCVAAPFQVFAEVNTTQDLNVVDAIVAPSDSAETSLEGALSDKNAAQESTPEQLPPPDEDNPQINNTSIPASVTLKPDQVSGALVYQYPIVVPPGRSKLQPNLLLTYNNQSAANDSIVGYGWSLNIPYIERTNRKGSEVLYDSIQPSYFDSSISGNLLTADGTTYHPEVDDGSFLKYSFDDVSWVVTDKRGNTFKYGSSPAARQDDPNNTNHVYRWYLEEERDANGNYIRYTYTKDSGQVYPSAIFYSGHDLADGIFEIDFDLESRPDTPLLFGTGFPVKTVERMHSITEKVNGAISRTYILAYSSNADNARSLLQSIAETGFDADGESTVSPPITFTYTNSGAANWSAEDPHEDNLADFPVLPHEVLGVFDANGDGLADIMKAYPNYNPGGGITYNKGSNMGWNNDPTSSLPATFETNVHYEMGDYNGDGYIDLMQDQRHAGAPAPGPNDYFNSGGGTWTIQPDYAPPYTETGYANAHEAGFATADINGDGLDDVLVNSYYDGPHTFINGGTSEWSERGWYTPNIYLYPYHSNPAVFTDLNGDGLADLVSDTGGGLSVSINNGAKDWNGNETVYWDIPPNSGFVTRTGNQAAAIADINGDGLPDLILANYGSGEEGVYLNKGDGTGWETVPDSRFTPPYNIGDPDSGLSFVTDANGDGVADFVRFTIYSGELFRNHATKPDLLAQIDFPAGGSSSVSYKQTPQLQGEDGPANPLLPAPLSVVTEIVTNSGLGIVGTTTYSYEGGQFYFATSTPPAAYERKFAGFSKVVETDPDGSVVDTYFHQGNGDATSTDEFQDDPAKIGHPYRVETYDSNNNLFRIVTNRWGAVSGIASSTFVPLLQTITSDYDGNSDHIDKAETYAYNDANGDLTERVEWGQVNAANDGSFTDVGTDKFVTDTTYAASSTSPLSLPSQVTTVDQASSTVRETTNYYDNLALGLASAGNLTKQLQWISGTTTAETDHTYNAYGLVTQTKDPDTNATNYTYDTYNLYPATTTNALGYTSAASYDYSTGKPTQTRNENGVTIKTIFDGLGRVAEIDQPESGSISGASFVSRTKYVYTDTSLPRSVKETDYLSSSTSTDSYTYLDGFGRTVQHLVEAEGANKYNATTNTYDARGLLHSESLPYTVTGTGYTGTSSPPSAALLTTYTYDTLQRPTAIANTLGTTTNAYDQWQVTTTDANGHARDFLKDAYGNLVQVVEHNNDGNYTTAYTYDGNNNLTKLTDANGNVRNFTYDGLGRRLSAEDLHAATTSALTWTYTYDAAGNLTQQKDPKNQTVNFTYDALNRPLTEDYTGAPGTEVQYGYDTCTYGKMQLCSATTSDAIDTYTYTPLGQRSSETATISGQTYTTTYAYDRLGNKIRITYPDGLQAQYAYNAAGLLDAISTKPTGTSTFSGLVLNFDYAPNGKVSYEQFANGVTSTYTYDPNQLYRLTNILTVGSTSPHTEAQLRVTPQLRASHGGSGGSSIPDVSSHEGSKPGVSTPESSAPSSSSIPSATPSNLIDRVIAPTPANVKQSSGPTLSTVKKTNAQVPPPASSAIQNISYVYDAVGNITNIIDYSGTQAAHVVSFGYDYLNRLTSASTTAASSTPYARTYTYDKTGSILSKTDVGTYTYTGANNANPQAPNTVGSVTLKYDKNGNMTKYAGNPYTWDYRNRLTSILIGIATSTYAYDYQNNRVKKVSSTTTTIYPNDLYSVSSSTATRNLFTNDGTLVSTITGTSTLSTAYIHPDNLGSTNAVTDSSGTVSLASDYYPYGSQRINLGTDQQRKYIGEEYDGDTALSYLNARYYDGTRGQFLSQDPQFWSVKQNYQDPQSLNSYAYANDNPIINKDPSGMDSMPMQTAVLMQFNWLNQQTGGALGKQVQDELTGYGMAVGTILGLLPGTGDVIGAQEAVTGKDSVTGSSLSIGERILAGFSILPIVGTAGDISRDIARVSRTFNWAKPSTLLDHFTRHGSDFGAKTVEDYAKMAQDFFKSASQNSIPTKVDEDGVVRIYDPTTNTFGSYTPNGQTKTYFKPDPKVHGYKTNLDYWNSQDGKLK